MINRLIKIDIKSRTCYFLDNMIIIRNLDLNEIKIYETLYQKYFYLLYWICDVQTF